MPPKTTRRVLFRFPWHLTRALHLPWAVMLDDTLPAGRHTFRVRLRADHHPQSTGTALRVFHLLLN